MIAKALLATCLVAFASDALASITLSQSVVVNNATNMVDFEIEFATPPDFLTADAEGRQADAFTYQFLDNLLDRNGIVVKANEIYLLGGIPIREVNMAAYETLLDTVPYSLNANVLTFSVDQSLFANGARPGSYLYESNSYGKTQTSISTYAAVPESGSLAIWCVLGICIGGVMLRWKRAGQA